VNTAVSIAVGLSVLVGALLKIGRWLGRLEAHLASQDREMAVLRRQMSGVHAAVVPEEEPEG
jgi:hypothetical protein